MKRETIAVLAAFVSSMAVPSQAAPIQWTVADGGNGHFYELVVPEVSFATARAAALAASHLGQSGYLASITSAAEQAFLNAFVNVNSVEAWLGGSDEETESVWKWLDGPEAGQVFTYTNWNDGEPNNQGGVEHYLQGWFIGGVLWNDFPAFPDDFFVLSYIVEYDEPSAIPVPASLPLLAAAICALGLAARRRKAS